jgi:hypothetical protein
MLKPVCARIAVVIRVEPSARLTRTILAFAERDVYRHGYPYSGTWMPHIDLLHAEFMLLSRQI